MLKRFVTGAVLALAASLGVAGAAGATTVKFDMAGFFATANPTFNDTGLTFASDEGYYIPTSAPEFFPKPFSSSFWETYNDPTLFPIPDPGVVVSLAAPGTFDLAQLDLGMGFGSDDSQPETAIMPVSWIFSDGTTGGENLTLGVGFPASPIIMNLTDLTSITFGATFTDDTLTTGVVRYVAFDNVVYTGHPDVVSGAAPEPAAWAMMIVGFGGVGALVRRQRRTVALAA